jgi:large subunit ribosomal protein L29
MDIDKVRALTDGELSTELATQRRHLYDLRFQLATRQLNDHSQLTQTRRTIARVLTVMTERGVDENIIAKPAPETRKPAARRARAKPAASAKPAKSATAAAAPAATGGTEE